MTVTGNIGEWSELYAIFKLLETGWLDLAADGDTLTPSVSHAVTAVGRDEAGTFVEHVIAADTVTSLVDGNELATSRRSEFGAASHEILRHIRSGNTTTFSIPGPWRLASHHGIRRLKGSSARTADVKVSISDPRAPKDQLFGYSIKSELGARPTLLNSSQSTNFIFKVCGDVDKRRILELNDLEGKHRIRDRILALESEGGSLQFVVPESGMLFMNLQIIDTCLPQIVAEMILLHYRDRTNSIRDLTAALNASNPVGYDLSREHPYYSYKIKQLLRDIALGMRAHQTAWDGQYDAGAGYIIVRPDGHLISFHLYNLNDFQDYLFSRASLDTPSSSRHKFGEFYANDDGVYMKLNLQIRYG